MSESSQQLFCSVLSENDIVFVSSNPLTAVSRITTGDKSLRSFSWSCDNKKFCFTGSEDFVSLANTNLATSHKNFADSMTQTISHFTRTQPDVLLTGGRTDLCTLWRIKDSYVLPLKGFKAYGCKEVKSASFDDTDSNFIVGSQTSTGSSIWLFEINRSLSPIKKWDILKDQINIVEFFPNNNTHFCATTHIGSFFLFDKNFDDPVMSLKNDFESPAIGVSFSSTNRNHISVCYSLNRVNFYDLSLRFTTDYISTSFRISSFSALPNGIDFLLGSDDGRLFKYDIRKKTEPVDVLKISPHSLNLISPQKGYPVFPCVEKFKNRTESPQVKPQKRRLRDQICESPLLKGLVNTPSDVSYNIKNIRSMFASPDIKKTKFKTAETTLNEESFEQPKENISISNPKETLPLPEIRISSRDLPCSTPGPVVSTFPKSQIPESSEFYECQEDDHGTTSKDFSEFRFSLYRELRDLQIELIRQQCIQAEEIKIHVSQVLIEHRTKELELLQENNYLRCEISRLQNVISSLKDSHIQNGDKQKLFH